MTMMMTTRRALALTAGALAAAAGAAPKDYRLDPAQSEVAAITRPSGIGSGLSHAHVIEGQGLSGTLTYDPEAPEQSAVQVSIPVASLVNDAPAARARHGLKDALSESDRKSIADTIRSDQQLDAARFPTLSFKSTRVRALPDGRLEVQGALTIRGVSKVISIPVQVKAEGAAVRGEGKVTIKHSDFGFKPVSLLFGAIANADEVELRIKLVGVAP
jgi:polyisoprenoid-binding protein YceI